MSHTTIDGVPVYCPNETYKTTGSQYWMNPVFFDPRTNSKGTLYFDASLRTRYNISGHFVIPIPKPEAAARYYATID